VEWLDFMLLNTYVPANKTKAELEATNEWRDKNRGRWDHETKMFAREVYKPLVWMGDFNVGLDASDKRPRIIRHPNEANPANPRRAGNLSSVQRKFSELLAAGSGLVDAFLHLHPAVGGGPQPMDMVEPWWTCYTNQGGCRIDYTLVSTSLRSRVTEATILGHAKFDKKADGRRKMALVGFCGSDHCPIMLELSEADGAEGEAADAAGGHGEAEDGAAAAPEEYSDEDDELRRLRENTP
jgi:exonuclease III